MTDERAWKNAVIHWLVALIVFGAFFLRLSVLWDTDSYYHLAVARLYATHGPATPVPWARFSVIGNGGDKDFLFHVLLIPFALLPDPALGGRIALAILNATLATLLAVLASRAVGTAGYAVPLWLYLASTAFFLRVVRLRPELVALALILAAIAAAARRRWIALGIVVFAFTLAYTAFHILVGLCVLWFLWSRWRENSPTHALLVASVGGAAAGLLIRPHPLANLRLWYVQNVLFFVDMRRLDIGNEILPPLAGLTLLRSAAWLAGIAAIVVVAVRYRSRPRGSDDVMLAYAAIAAIVFVILFTRMGRMAIYAFPLATLAILFACGRRVPARALLAILSITTIAAIPVTFDRERRAFIAAGASDVSEADYAAFGRAVPTDAKIAARWTDAEIYAFAAPQGRYLDVLDPVFMAVRYPAQYEAQRRMFAGDDPDFPRTAARTLDSDFIAIDWTAAPRDFVERLRADPRLKVVYGGYNALFRIVPPPTASFITVWSPLRRGRERPDPLDAFVDATSLAANGCATVRAVVEMPARLYEFAPWGPSELTIDGALRARVPTAPHAFLGRGVRVAIDAGVHSMEVRTCADSGMAGFFFR